MGPARSPWSYGRGGRAAGKPSCNPANLFTECFRGCNTSGNCGWVTVVGTVVFTGENVQLDPVFGVAVIFKPFLCPQKNVTVQIRFREINAPPTGAMIYGMGGLDAAGVGINGAQLFGDGTLHVFAAGIQYTGAAWSPQAGAVHTVHLTVDAAGTPTLFIDQVQIPLVLGGPVGPPAPFGPAAVFSLLNSAPDGPAVLYDMFFASGVYSPDTVFCCPSGFPLP